METAMFSNRSAFPELSAQEYLGEPVDVLIAGSTNPWVEVAGEPVDWTARNRSPGWPANECEMCLDERVPGVLTAMDANDGIQRCDSCGRFDSDLAAAKAVADVVGGRVMFYAQP